MSRLTFFDCETVPRPEAELLALMPPEMANPIMPAELEIAPDPDLTACPKYNGDEAKQGEWRMKTIAATKGKWMQAREVWSQKAEDAKAKFCNDAALYAERGQLKLMSYRENEKTACVVIDTTQPEREKILAEKHWPSRVVFQFCTEKEALADFHKRTLEARTFKAKFCGYWIEGFDLPFTLRRQMLTGSTVSRHLMRTPRYFDDEWFIDLCQCWQMGDKQAHTGGLAGLSKLLGIQEKEGSGEGFYRLWNADPCAAVKYSLAEMLVIEQVAKKMGIS